MNFIYYWASFWVLCRSKAGCMLSFGDPQGTYWRHQPWHFFFFFLIMWTEMLTQRILLEGKSFVHFMKFFNCQLKLLINLSFLLFRLLPQLLFGFIHDFLLLETCQICCIVHLEKNPTIHSHWINTQIIIICITAVQTFSTHENLRTMHYF